MSEMTRFRMIETKFDSKCLVCRTTLPHGTHVWWKKGHRVLCDECCPHEERSHFGSNGFDPERQKRQLASDRKDAILRLFPFIRRDPEGAAVPLLAELVETNEPDEINSLIDEIYEVTEPATRRN
jgi:hypothetical protein